MDGWVLGACVCACVRGWIGSWGEGARQREGERGTSQFISWEQRIRYPPRRVSFLYQ